MTSFPTNSRSRVSWLTEPSPESSLTAGALPGLFSISANRILSIEILSCRCPEKRSSNFQIIPTAHCLTCLLCIPKEKLPHPRCDLSGGKIGGTHGGGPSLDCISPKHEAVVYGPTLHHRLGRK